MRLLLLTSEFYPRNSGGALEQWHLSRELAERGHDITVLTPKRETTPSRESRDGVTIVRPTILSVDMFAPNSAAGIATRLLCSLLIFVHTAIHLSRSSVDGIYVTDHEMHWVGAVLTRWFSAPLVSYVSYTSSLEHETETVKAMLEKINFRYFMGDEVLCRSPQIQPILDEACGRSSRLVDGILNTDLIETVANETDPTDVRRRYDVADGQSFFAFVGRLEPTKRPMEAIEILESAGIDYRLIVAGDGPEAETLRSSVHDCGFGDRVELTGHLSQVAVFELLYAADALILTSERESYSAVILEALAFGCEVFATPVGIAPRLDVERLHVGELNNLTNHVAKIDPRGDYRFNKLICDSYSIDRYADSVIDAFDRL